MKVKDFITGLFILLAVGAMLTSCEKEPIEEVTEEVTVEEVPEEVGVVNFNDVQARLDTGELPIDIWRSGIPLKNIYNRKTYKGGYICYLDTLNGGGLIAHKKRLSSINFKQAKQYAEDLSVKSKDSMFYYSDWRIPTRWELLYLAKQRQTMPYNSYSNSRFDFLSSTRYNSYSGYSVVIVDFMTAKIKEKHSETSCYAKCVRSFNNYIEL